MIAAIFYKWRPADGAMLADRPLRRLLIWLVGLRRSRIILAALSRGLFRRAVTLVLGMVRSNIKA